MIAGLARFSLVSGLVGFYMGWAVVESALPGSPYRRQERRVRMTRRFARFGLRALGVRIRPVMRNTDKAIPGQGLIVANHVSWLDVLVIMALTEAVFVTSVEIRDSGFLGFLAKAGGSLFVERRRKTSVRDDVAMIGSTIRHTRPVVIFPEATSTNGEDILKFRESLFETAATAECAVHPVCIAYQTVAGKSVDRGNRDLICWYGSMDFLPHLWNLCKAGGVEVDVHVLNSIKDVGDRKTTARTAHAVIRETYMDHSPLAAAVRIQSPAKSGATIAHLVSLRGPA